MSKRRRDLLEAQRLAATGDADGARALFAAHGITYITGAQVAGIRRLESDPTHPPACACRHGDA